MAFANTENAQGKKRLHSTLSEFFGESKVFNMHVVRHPFLRFCNCLVPKRLRDSVGLGSFLGFAKTPRNQKKHGFNIYSPDIAINES